MKLSICMMIKNEEKNLYRCLDAVKKLMDKVESELIIVDTGSTDSSVEIAREYTDKVYFHQWNNNFSEMRNKSISYAKGEWILIIDADEVIDTNEGIVKFLNDGYCKTYNSATIEVVNFTSSVDKNLNNTFSSLRLFRNDGTFRYEGAVHNQPYYIKPTYEINDTILHYGYISDDRELMERKFKRTSELLKAELEKDPENIYYWHQLSVSYHMHNELNKSIEYGEKAYKLLKSKDIEKQRDSMYVFNELALVYLKNKNYDKCEKVCLEVMELRNEYLDIYYYMANLKYDTEKYEDCIRYCEIYLKMQNGYYENPNIDRTIGSHTLDMKDDILCLLAMGYSKIDDYDNCIENYHLISGLENKKRAMRLWVDSILNVIDGESILVEEIKNDTNGKKLMDYLYEIMELRLKVDSGNIRLLNMGVNLGEKYSLLSRIRLLMINGNYSVDNKVFEQITKIDFNDLSGYYGDIIWFVLSNETSLEDIIAIREDKLSRFIKWISDRYENYSEVVVKYLKETNANTLIGIKNRKVFLRSILILDKLSESEYKEAFMEYINTGITYIDRIYNENIIREEISELLRSDEDEFFMYMTKAMAIKESDPKRYLSYLMKALKAYELMDKGIGLLKDDFAMIFNEKDNEIADLKEQLFANINTLLLNNKIKDAEDIIMQYEEVWGTDMKLLLFKSKIKMAKNKGTSQLDN